MNGHDGLQADGEITRAVFNADRHDYDRLAILGIDPFLGGSVIHARSTDVFGSVFTVESTVHEGLIYLHLVDLTKGDIAQLSIVKADGGPLPEGVKLIQGKVLVLEKKPDARLFDIKAIAILKNGREFIETVRIDLSNGVIERAENPNAQSGALRTTTFSEQLFFGQTQDLHDETRLLNALNWK